MSRITYRKLLSIDNCHDCGYPQDMNKDLNSELVLPHGVFLDVCKTTLGLNDEEARRLWDSGNTVNLVKKSHLIHAGQEFNGLYLVLAGIVREYTIEGARDISLYFSAEGGVTGGYDAYFKRKQHREAPQVPTKPLYSIQNVNPMSDPIRNSHPSFPVCTTFGYEALEDSLLFKLAPEALLELDRFFPAWARIEGIIAQNLYLCAVERLRLLQLKPARVRVEQFSRGELWPLLSRIPQHYVASYLNLEPETFSRLRSEVRYIDSSFEK